MKTPARLCLMLLAGLSLAGCATKSASLKPAPVEIADARERSSFSAREHWYLRDLEDRIERTFEAAGSR